MKSASANLIFLASYRAVLRLLPGELGLLVPGLVHGEPERVRGPGGQAGQHGRAQGPGHSLECGEKKYFKAAQSFCLLLIIQIQTILLAGSC